MDTTAIFGCISTDCTVRKFNRATVVLDAATIPPCRVVTDRTVDKGQCTMVVEDAATAVAPSCLVVMDRATPKR